MYYQLGHNLLNGAERIIPKEDPYYLERMESLKRTALALSETRLDHPNKLSALRCCPDIFVQEIVSVEKMDEYIGLFRNEVVEDEMEMVRLINLYRVKILCVGEFGEREKEVFLGHLDWFYQNMSIGSSVLINSFIRLVLVVARRRYMVWNRFP
jgi:hypothetical protein